MNFRKEILIILVSIVFLNAISVSASAKFHAVSCTQRDYLDNFASFEPWFLRIINAKAVFKGWRIRRPLKWCGFVGKFVSSVLDDEPEHRQMLYWTEFIAVLPKIHGLQMFCEVQYRKNDNDESDRKIDYFCCKSQNKKIDISFKIDDWVEQDL